MDNLRSTGTGKRILVWKLKDLDLKELKTEKKKAKSAGPMVRKQERLINEAANFNLHGCRLRGQQIHKPLTTCRAHSGNVRDIFNYHNCGEDSLDLY